MKYFFIITFLSIFTSCSFDNDEADKNINTPLPSQKTASKKPVGDTSKTGNLLNDEYATYYLVIADTATNYNILQQKMYSLSKLASIKVDTMGRYFNKKKNLICLPDNDKDEIYRGDYVSRRFPGKTLSIEYFDYYTDDTSPKNMALVAGIYDNKKSADSVVTNLKPFDYKAYTLQADIYVGCMH